MLSRRWGGHWLAWGRVASRDKGEKKGRIRTLVVEGIGPLRIAEAFSRVMPRRGGSPRMGEVMEARAALLRTEMKSPREGPAGCSYHQEMDTLPLSGSPCRSLQGRG